MTSKLELARAVMAAKRAAGEAVRLDPIEKHAKNPTSLRMAVNGKCWDCVGGGADANPRGAIRSCKVVACCLHSVRPYQAGGDDDE